MQCSVTDGNSNCYVLPLLSTNTTNSAAAIPSVIEISNI